MTLDDFDATTVKAWADSLGPRPEAFHHARGTFERVVLLDSGAGPSYALRLPNVPARVMVGAHELLYIRKPA